MSESLDSSFAEVVGIIQQTRKRTYQAANTLLIELYWQVGEYISLKIESENWGTSVVQQLAEFLKRKQIDVRRFLCSKPLEDEAVL